MNWLDLVCVILTAAATDWLLSRPHADKLAAPLIGLHVFNLGVSYLLFDLHAFFGGALAISGGAVLGVLSRREVA